MARKAAIVIGVDHVERLVPLEAAAICARGVAAWLGDEGYDVECLTDEQEPVTTARVDAAIDRFVTSPPRYHQLLVYFSGHGYWQARADVWLLSKAARKTSEAINLDGAIDLARYSGIPNVIFVSDACRSLPDARTAALVTGIDAFPLFDGIDTQSKIDVFRATGDAREAYEAKVNGQPTSMLTFALRSAFREPSDDMVAEIDGNRVVPNRRLEAYLQSKIDETLAAVDINLRQRIEASVPSDDRVYIARVEVPPPSPRSAPPSGSDPVLPDAPAEPALRPPPPPSVARDAADGLERMLTRIDLAPDAGPLELPYEDQKTARRVASLLPGPLVDHFESQCGFSIFGARVSEAIVSDPKGALAVELLERGDGEGSPGVVRCWGAVGGEHPGGSVLLRFDDGRVAVLAALAGYIGHLTVGRTGVRNVSYVPSANHNRFGAYQQKHERLDKLRALVALAADENVFRLGTDREARTLADEIRLEKALDPTLGLYAAHAYAQASDVERVRSVAEYMRHDLDADLFDLRVLASRRGQPPPDLPVLPFCPLLTQTWNLLRPRGIELPPVLLQARAWLANSLWTTFESHAWEPLSDAVKSGELK